MYYPKLEMRGTYSLKSVIDLKENLFSFSVAHTYPPSERELGTPGAFSVSAEWTSAENFAHSSTEEETSV